MRVAIIGFFYLLCCPAPSLFAAPSRRPRAPASRPARPPAPDRDSAGTTQHPRLSDPLWARAWKDLRSNNRLQRQRAIHWLSQQQDPWATQLLIQTTRHRDPRTRWWAVVALRSRPYSPRLQKVFRQLLRDTYVEVRLNAVVALLQHKQWQGLLPLLRDRSPNIRDVLCQALVRQQKGNRKAWKACLQDRSALVRLHTARLLLRPPHASQVSKDLREMARRVLRAGIRNPFTSPRPQYSPRQRLATALRQLNSYTRALRRLQRRASCFLARQYCDCLKRALRRFRRQRQKFLDWEELYKARQGALPAERQRILSQALLAYHKAQAAYLDGSLCRQYNRSNRLRKLYRRLLKNAMYTPYAPMFLASSSLNYMRISTRFLHDTAMDALRDDIHPVLPPYPVVKGPLNGLSWQTALELSYHLLFKDLLLLASNRTMLMVTTLPKEIPLNVDNDFQFSLLYRRQRRRMRLLLFVEERLRYTPNPPDEEGYPDQLGALRLSQYARVGLSLRWGRLYRNHWSRGDWLLHLDYTNHIQWPLLSQQEPLTWSRRMTHRWELHVSRQILFFRVGLRNNVLLHQMWDVSAQLPTAQWNLYATLSVGDIFDPTALVRLDAGVGFNLSQYLDIPSHPAIPVSQEPAVYAGEAFYARITGFAPSLPIQWQLFYQYRAGPPQRPLYPFFLEHRFHGWVRFGNIRQLDPFYPRSIHIDLGLDIRFQIYRPFRPQQADEPEPQVVRAGTLYAQIAYPLWRGLRGVIGNRLTLLDNEFRPYGNDKESTTTVVRNIVFIQLEYWFGGIHDPSPKHRRIP